MLTATTDRPPDTIGVDQISAAEMNVRRDLAACYQLVSLFGWDELITNHITARIPGEDAFLINPFGMLFEEIGPMDLVKLDMQGNVLGGTDSKLNVAGFVIHSAIFLGRPDVNCVLHLHTEDGVAVASLKEGLLPMTQTSLLVMRDVAYHDCEGASTDLDERSRLARDLGDKHLMILRNHGTMAVGRTVAQAFVAMYYLEKSCSHQIRALATGRPLQPIAQEVIDNSALVSDDGSAGFCDELIWPAMLRKLDRVRPYWRGGQPS